MARGYIVTEDVRPGQPITMYARNVISELEAEIRKNKVRAHQNISVQDCDSVILLCCLDLCRAIGTLFTITPPAAAWTPCRLQCEAMSITVADIRLLDS